MLARRPPDQPPDSHPPAAPTPEADIDLDFLPDLPPIPPPARREPEVEPPPADPAWHASAAPTSTPTPTPREKPARSILAPPPREKAAQAEPPSPAPADPAALTQVAPASVSPLATHPSIALPPRPAVSTASDKPAPARLKPTSESVIGPDDFFDGRYRSERGVRIQGNARGSIESRQYIFVEGGAQVEADLSAEDITISGDFKGKISCRRRLEVTSTGKIQGQVQTALLVVQEGGALDGGRHMRVDQAEAASE